MDGSITGTPYMMRWDLGWAQTAWTSSGETCSSNYPQLSTEGRIAVAAVTGGSYSGGHGGCGVAVTDVLGNFRANYIRLTNVSPGANCHAGSVDFPAAYFQLGQGYTAFNFGSNHYVGHRAAGGTTEVSGYLGSPHTVMAYQHSVTERSDYRFHLGVKTYGPCTNIVASLKLWFVWAA